MWMASLCSQSQCLAAPQQAAVLVARLLLAPPQNRHLQLQHLPSTSPP